MSSSTQNPKSPHSLAAAMDKDEGVFAPSAKPKKSQLTIAQRRKKEICEAAKTLFLQQGFANTTMEDVIEQTSLSKGGVYYYFSSTHQMLAELMREGTARQFAQFVPTLSLDVDSELSRSEVMIDHVMDKFFGKNEYKSIYAMFLLEAQNNPELQELDATIRDEWIETFIAFTQAHNLEQFKGLLSESFITFVDSMVVSSEFINAGDVLSKEKELFAMIVSYFIAKPYKPPNPA